VVAVEKLITTAGPNDVDIFREPSVHNIQKHLARNAEEMITSKTNGYNTSILAIRQ